MIDPDTTALVLRLQQLQQRLCDLYSARDDLTDPAILAISEEADDLVILLQRRLMAEAEYRKLAQDRLPCMAKLSIAQPTEKIAEQGGALVMQHS